MDLVIFVAPAHEDDVPILRSAHKALIGLVVPKRCELAQQQTYFM